MPAEYRIDVRRGLVLSRAWGFVSGADLKQHGKGLLADRDFKPEFNQLWDASEVTGNDTEFAELDAIAQINVFAHTTRRSIFAPTDAAFGFARMFQMLREAKGDTGLRVYRTLADARRWIDEGVDTAPPVRMNSADSFTKPGRR